MSSRAPRWSLWPRYAELCGKYTYRIWRARRSGSSSLRRSSPPFPGGGSWSADALAIFDQPLSFLDYSTRLGNRQPRLTNQSAALAARNRAACRQSSVLRSSIIPNEHSARENVATALFRARCVCYIISPLCRLATEIVAAANPASVGVPRAIAPVARGSTPPRLH